MLGRTTHLVLKDLHRDDAVKISKATDLMRTVTDKSLFDRFTNDELLNLAQIYELLRSNKNQKLLGRRGFCQFISVWFNIQSSFFLNRIFFVFDKNQDNVINFEEFVDGMGICLYGDLDMKIKYAMKIYDLTDDGFLERAEVVQLLKEQAGNDEEVNKAMPFALQGALSIFQLDNKKFINVREFRNIIYEYPWALTFLGPCIIPHRRRVALLRILSDRMPYEDDILEIPNVVPKENPEADKIFFQYMNQVEKNWKCDLSDGDEDETAKIAGFDTSDDSDDEVNPSREIN